MAKLSDFTQDCRDVEFAELLDLASKNIHEEAPEQVIGLLVVVMRRRPDGCRTYQRYRAQLDKDAEVAMFARLLQRASQE